MIATDGTPTIANASQFRVTSRTMPNGVRKYIVVTPSGAELSGLHHNNMSSAYAELEAHTKGK